jgi:hypothetical protein
MAAAKPSKQMAFQLSEYEYRQILGRLTVMYVEKDAKSTIEEWVDAFEPDEKKRDRIKAVLVISVRCNNEGIEPLAVRKIVCWRGPDGKPQDLEATIDGKKAMEGAIR